MQVCGCVLKALFSGSGAAELVNGKGQQCWGGAGDDGRIGPTIWVGAELFALLGQGCAGQAQPAGSPSVGVGMWALLWQLWILQRFFDIAPAVPASLPTGLIILTAALWRATQGCGCDRG